MPTALIAGATGLIGRRVAQRLLEAGTWNVTGLARRPPATAGMRWIAVDLTDAGDCRRKLAGLAVTHLFYTARADHPEGASERGQPASAQAFTPEAVEINAAMLSNVVNAAAANGALEHVHVVHGSKYYGHQLGPIEMPAREDGPRAPGRNFYFDQEDFLRSRSRAAAWSFTITRPHTFCDPAADMPRSVGLLIAVYAAIQRELGLPLAFPGTARAYEVRTQFTDIALLARAIVWMATEPRCADQAFNIINGDYPRWSELWPQFARQFGLEPGAPRAIDFGSYIADKDDIWRRIIQRHALRPTALESLVLWPYGNYVFKPEWDIMSSAAKVRACGFLEIIDTASMFALHFDHYRAEKIIP